MQEKETEIKGLATEIKPESEETERAPEGEQWVALPAADFEEMIQKAAKAAVAEFKKQEEKEKKRDKYHNTFTLMKCYRDAVFHIENAISDGTQLELCGMTDEQQDRLEHMRLNYPERIQKSQGVADGLTAALTFCDEGAFTDA
jgi:hypothetical protein